MLWGPIKLRFGRSTVRQTDPLAGSEAAEEKTAGEAKTGVFLRLSARKKTRRYFAAAPAMAPAPKERKKGSEKL